MDNKKSLIALVLVVLVGIIGGTYAYFTSTAILNNSFKTGTYSTSVKEEFVSPDNWTPGTTTTKKVNVTNKGTVDIAARATYTEKWTAADGSDLSLTRDGEPVAQFTIGSDWELGTDGYYYYKDTLSNGETSTDFLNSVTFNPNFELQEDVDINCETTEVDGKTTVTCANLTSGYAGATYTLEITIETIQADQKWTYTADPSSKVYTPGDEIVVVGETFNVIKDNGDTITMLAAYSLGTDYRQSETEAGTEFSNGIGWEYTPGPKEIDIQAYDGEAKTYVNEYVSYLQSATGDTALSGTLITLAELKDLGCTISDDYSWSSGLTCANSDNVDWLVNGQSWWTRSAEPGDPGIVWNVITDGGLSTTFCNLSRKHGIRPVITISKSTLASL